MITLDSIKIHAPCDLLTDFNFERFKKTTDVDGARGHTTKDRYYARGTITGLKSIEINNINQSLTLELSAKILLDDYSQLININNIERVFDTVNKSGLIAIDKTRINEFDVHSIDSTKNLKGVHRPKQYFDNLMLIAQSPKYIKEAYRGTGDNKHKTGVVFRGKQKTFKERMLCYDKREELLHEKKFLKSVNNPMQVVKDFYNVARIECNLTNYARIREYLQVPDQNLIRILESQSTPNWTIWKRIKGAVVVQLELFNYPETMKWHELVSYYGLRQICLDCQNDLSLIKDLIRKHTGVKTNVSPQMKKVKQVIQSLNNTGTGTDTETDNEVLQEFEQLLKTA